MSLYSGFAGFGPIGLIFFIFLGVCLLGIIIYNGMHKKRPLEKKESNYAYRNHRKDRNKNK
ncbi:hypothetical protein [Aminicella lysinilytica]|uniref:hypothetical protein n=1 Tax=Aminicella lysinilytica TaxID=433323 RepID=UPI0026F37819|nr:hypothetical protein [Aminicella lysinilytica]